jgi:hypothetical protein
MFNRRKNGHIKGLFQSANPVNGVLVMSLVIALFANAFSVNAIASDTPQPTGFGWD